MSDLLKRIANLTIEAINSNAKTMNLYFELNKAYDELPNEKFADVAGLKRPNFVALMNGIKDHTEILSNNKFSVESRIDEKLEEQRKKWKAEWKELTKKIPQVDDYYLEGIKTWRVSNFELIPDTTYVREPLFKEEMIKLIAAGFPLGFNTEFGTGSIHVENIGFTIELWQWNKQQNIHKDTMDGVISWLTNFFEQRKV